MRQLTFTGSKPQRLDAFLLESYPALKPGTLHKTLRQNKIKVNGKKQPLAHRLEAGDEVKLYLPEEAFAPPTNVAVVYEDARLLVLDKPAGLATLGPDGSDTLESRAAARALQQGGPMPLPCHRLDTGTSGLVLFAKDTAMLAFVEELIRTHSLEKTYLCATVGTPAPAQAALQGWHSKNAKAGTVRITPRPRPGAKPVETRYRVVKSTPDLALVEVALITGRTHQIRAHMAAQGTPLLGDSKYGTLTVNRQYRCRYQCLCARTLRFPTIRQKGYQAYSGLTLQAAQPWFEAQLLAGTLL